jgi:hypothetical protein
MMHRTGLITLYAIALLVFPPVLSAHDGAHGPVQPVSPAAEALIHTAPGVSVAGVPAIAEGAQSALLNLRVVDAATDQPTYCRVNVIGPDGNYYEPETHAQQPWSLQRLGNRKEKGPFRYYGWFFYCDGEEPIRVPAGDCSIEVWKGFEYRPARQTLSLAAETTQEVAITLERTLDMAAQGWYSGDPHIHLNRRNDADLQRALDLCAAEDIRYGFLLGMNDPKHFNGVMADQEWPQLQGMGDASVLQRGDHWVSSGFEYRNSTFGHILLLMADELLFKDQILAVNEWPTFAEVAKEVHRLNGKAIHAHGGYEKEIYADFIPGATDGVELLQFAVYRGIGLEGWYHMLNAGFRFPSIGASDFPYCRALGDCRTYVRLGEDKSMRAWTDAAVAGRSFMTTGPMLEFTVDGAGPGETVNVDESASTVEVALSIRSEVATVSDIEILANGVAARHFRIDRSTRAGDLPQRLNYRLKLPLSGSTWFAARAYGEQVAGLPDAEAHTNPVYILRGGAPIANSDSVQWLLAKLDANIAEITAMDFEKKSDVLQYYNDCRALLSARLADGE